MDSIASVLSPTVIKATVTNTKMTSCSRILRGTETGIAANPNTILMSHPLLIENPQYP